MNVFIDLRNHTSRLLIIFTKSYFGYLQYDTWNGQIRIVGFHTVFESSIWELDWWYAVDCLVRLLLFNKSHCWGKLKLLRRSNLKDDPLSKDERLYLDDKKINKLEIPAERKCTDVRFFFHTSVYWRLLYKYKKPRSIEKSENGRSFEPLIGDKALMM